MTIRSIEAEQAVIGSILIDARCLDSVAQLLRPQDFGMEINRAMYRVILSMDREGRKIDPVTVKEVALQAGAEIPNAYLMELMDVTPTAANAEEYAKIVREDARKRGISALSEYITAELANHASISELLMETARRVEDLQKDGITEDLLDPDSAMLAFYEHRDLVSRGGGAFIPTGYQDLDKILGGGMLRSGMYILAARPGMGKSTLAINIADRVARTGKTVVFVSLEMDPEQLEAKRLARETGIPGDRLLMDCLTEEEEAQVAQGSDIIRALPVHINKRETATVAQIEQMARRVKGLSLIVIDYIGKVLPETRGRSSNRTEYMTEISGDIKNLARRFRVPVLALCQLNRALADRRDPTPILSDLRDTGAIEQDADGVIFLHRTDYYQLQAGSGLTSDLQVIVAKNRHGAVGECALAFDLAGSKLTTSRRGPIARRKQLQEEQLGPTQLSWEDLSRKLDREFPFDRKETYHETGR